MSSAAAAGAESGAPSEPPSDIDEIKKLREQLKGCRYEDFTVSSYAIGGGTFARVHLCYHNKIRKCFALKVMSKAWLYKNQQLLHIKRERDLLLEIDHPFCVRFISSFTDELCVYYVLEFVPGGDLFCYRAFRQLFQLPEEQVKFYAAEIVLFLRHLHSKNIAYRDLKPENIMLDKHGHVKVVDFGFAKRLASDGRTFTLCGSEEYYAPELFNLAKTAFYAGLSVDWWCLGILIYDLLIGRTPFHNQNPKVLMFKVLNMDPVFPASVDLSEPCKDIIRRLLDRNHVRRLGCSRLDAAEVMEHPWFASIDWERLERRAVEAPSPPVVQSDSDVANFELSTVQVRDGYAVPLPPDIDALFAEF